MELCLSRSAKDLVVVQSVILTLHSPFFKASLSGWWFGQQSNQIEEGPIKWKCQLQFNDDNDDDETIGTAMFSKALSLQGGFSPRPALIQR